MRTTLAVAATLAAMLLPAVPAHADRSTPPPCGGYTCPSPPPPTPPPTAPPTSPPVTTPPTATPSQPTGVSPDRPDNRLPVTGPRGMTAAVAGAVAVAVGAALILIGRRRRTKRAR